ISTSARANDGNTGWTALVLILLTSPGKADRAFIAATDDLHQIEIPRGVFLEALHHGFEHIEGLTLVLDERIFLAVTAKTDSLFEVVHIQQVVFPLLVEYAQHDHALVITHGFGTDKLFLCVVTLFQLFEDGVAEFLAVQSFWLNSFGENVYAEAREDRIFQSF